MDCIMGSIWIAYEQKHGKKRYLPHGSQEASKKPSIQGANRLEAHQFSEENEQHINLGFKTHHAHAKKQGHDGTTVPLILVACKPKHL